MKGEEAIYANSGQEHDSIILWGAPSSLWTGRVRAYLIKKGLDYEEHFPANTRFQTDIAPQIGYFAVPVTEFKDGTLIQDGTDTMEYLEALYPQRPMIPIAPVQRAVSWLIELFGCDLFFIPAMHYRFNFTEQRDFIDAEFARGLSLSKDPLEQQEAVGPTRDFFKQYVELLGINESTIPAIEASHIECLHLLDAHFIHHPYLMGGHPSIADFGLIGPLYAHLGRDPVPSSLMKNVAPHVYRWTERMFEAGLRDGGFVNTEAKFLADDAIPDTLIPFIEYLFRDCGPQLKGTLETYNAWANLENRTSGSLIQIDPEMPLGAHPHVGSYSFTLRDTVVHSQAFSNVVHHYQRVLDVIESLDDEGRAAFDALVKRMGGEHIMSTKLVHRINNDNYSFTLA